MDNNNQEWYLDTEKENTLKIFIQKSADALDKIAQERANQAFNQGCWVGLLPVFILVISVFFLTKGNWIATFITGAFLAIALLGFANLAAHTALNNTTQRVYNEDILPSIKKTIDELGINQKQFDQFADKTLPQDSLLRRFVAPQNELAKTDD